MKKTSLATVFLFCLACVLPSRGAYAQNQYNLPHFANGNFGLVYKTSFILFNNTDTAVTATLKLTDNNGKPLSVTITGLGTNSQFNIPLDPGTTKIYQSDGNGSAQGAATVSSTGPIGVSAVFTVLDSAGNFVTESGVGVSDAMTDFVLPVDSTGSALTGLALFNPGTADALLTLTLFNTDGSPAGSMPLSLASGNHLAAFVALNSPGQFFPTLTSFRGTMQVQSTTPVSAMVLSQYQKNSTTICYTSLPVVSRSYPKTALKLAQVANGVYGSVSFKTTFLIFNISSAPANISLELTDDNGNSFSVNIPGNGIGTGAGATRSFTLQPNASIFLQTDGLGAGNAGAASITSNVPIGASAIFTVFNAAGFQTEAGIGDSPVMASLTLPVDVTGLFDTGIAFFNPGSSPVALTLELLDMNGNVAAGTTARTLPSINAHGHLASFINDPDLFPGTSNFKGSLAVTAPVGIASTVLRQYNSGANFTTLPTVWGTAIKKAGPPATIVAEWALAQTGLAIGQASTVLQSQFQILMAKLENATACTALDGGGSVQAGATAITVYYDSNCTKPYVVASPSITTGDEAFISETAIYYGLNGANLGSMTLNESANLGATSDILNGLGTFTPANGAGTPVQLGLYCTLDESGVGQCGGGIAQDLPELGLAVGAVTPLTLAYNPNSITSPVTFTGGGSVVSGPIGSLTLTNPSPTSLVIQGGTTFATTGASGGAAEFGLFPPTPTAWTLTDSAHDEQFQVSLVDNATRSLTLTIKTVSTGSTLAAGTLDQSGTGTITWSDGTGAVITNWTLAAEQ